MVAPAFEYVAAGTYDEAVRLLAASGEEAKILAGGQSLMPMLNLRLAHPELLIDINPADQREPSLADGLLRLPALTRHRVLLEHDLVRRGCPLLAEAVRHVGNVRVRNRGTIGGSLAHADPTSEIGCCALATGAQVVARGPAEDGPRNRTVPASELFAGYWTTTLAESEIITDVLIPAARPGQGWSFQEMVRRTSDFAIVAVAALVDLDERTRAIAAANIALAGVADRVVLADPDVLAALTGGTADEDLDAAAAGIAERLEPASDVHASGEYRSRLARVLTARALRQARARAARAVS
jgi:carbon-monoxide dehydrogenase medium subunit